jgi:hypothetical protein
MDRASENDLARPNPVRRFRKHYLSHRRRDSAWRTQDQFTGVDRVIAASDNTLSGARTKDKSLLQACKLAEIAVGCPQRESI